jgi:hypothetical protein
LLYELREVADWHDYEEKSLIKIIKIIEKVSCKCKDKSHRAVQIYKLFLSFLQKMRKNIKK